MGDMGDIFRDWKEFWRERRDINQADAESYFHEITSILQPLRIDNSGGTWLFRDPQGKNISYYPRRGRWYRDRDPKSIDGGIVSFIGWLQNHYGDAREAPETAEAAYEERPTASESDLPLKVKLIDKNNAITVGPLNPLYNEKDPFK